MATTEPGHAANRVYTDQDGDFHVNGANIYADESGTTLVGSEITVLDGVTAGTVTASKALVVDANKQLNELQFAVETVTPNNDSGAASSITAGVRSVTVAAVTNDANDWIVLPAIADVPVGHQIVIDCAAGTNFEMRTVASSGTTINGVDSDGTQEYLCTDTEVIFVTKHADGYVATALSALGAVVTAVIPD
jgi:hypothetical protein